MPISSAGTSQYESIHAKASTHVYTAAHVYAVSHADLHSLPDVYALANTGRRPDLHAVSNIRTVAYTHTYSGADLHAIPDIYALAHVYTDTRTDCYGGADADTVYLQHVMSGEPVLLEGVDTLVLAYGHRSETALQRELDGRVAELHAVGDCLSPRTAEEAVLEGLRVGTLL